MAKTRIVLVDDHAVLRAGLRLLLNAQPDLEVVGEAGDTAAALQCAEQLQPNLVLLDLTLPGQGGISAIPAIRRASPATRILVLTMHDDEGYLKQALRAGASGYLLKRAADSELLSAIQAVLRGEVFVEPSLTRVLVEELFPVAPTAHDPWDALSEREREVLSMVARGHTSAEIAAQLSLSPKTVETYRARGMEKLNLRTRAALVQFALTRHLLSDLPIDEGIVGKLPTGKS
jgi:two-component system, NarL family, response regulator NreC